METDITKIEKFDNLWFGYVNRISNIVSHTIAVIDASGSMSSCWGSLVSSWNIFAEKYKNNLTTIKFASNSKIIEENILKTSDCGGGTEILSGFYLVNDSLQKMKSQGIKDFTIIFISDGEDNNKSTIEHRINTTLNIPSELTINLICIGVGSGFPTFISMQLREKYHNGNPSIPAVFLSSNSGIEFPEILQNIQQFITKLEFLDCKPDVQAFPWSFTLSNRVFENSWFITQERLIKVGMQEIETSQDLSMSNVITLFKSWTQELSLISLKRSVREEAKLCLDLMNFMKNKLNSQLEKGVKTKKVLTVFERINMKDNKTESCIIDDLISEVRKFSEGDTLKELSQQEAAKRLAIGTTQGKYHSKALRSRGLEESEYNKYKIDFIDILKKTKLNEESNQEPSFISLQTQKEVFMEDTLIQAINQCNAYELVQNMPLVGHSILVRRTDGSMINPFLIKVIAFMKHNKSCDSVSLVNSNNEMEISIGNDEDEKINAVLPLFSSEKDVDMKPLLRSHIYHLLMTFNCMRNVDTFYFDAYYGLLANGFVRLLKYPDSAWKFELIDKIYSTMEMIYGGTKKFEQCLELMLDQPKETLVTENIELQIKCEDMSKALINLLVLMKRGKADKEACKKILELIIIEHFGRTISQDSQVFDIVEEKDENVEMINVEDKINLIKDENVEMINVEDKINLIKDQTIKKDDKYKSGTKTEISKTTKESYIANKMDNLKEILDKHINSIIESEMKFSDVKQLKIHLKTSFEQLFDSNIIKQAPKLLISESTFNKKGYRINLNLFKDAHQFFVGNSLDNNIFYIGIDHALKFSSSKDRSKNEINFDSEKVIKKLETTYINQIFSSIKDQLYSKFEDKIVKTFNGYITGNFKEIRKLNLGNNIFKNVAILDPDSPHFNIVVFGPPSSGKSSLIGKLLYETGNIDKSLYQNFINGFKLINKRDDPAWHWIANTSVDERSKNSTIHLNIARLSLKNKFFNIFDTPSSNKYFKTTSRAIALSEEGFLCISTDEDFKSNKNYIKMRLIYCACNHIKSIYVIITKIDSLDLSNNDTLKILLENIKKELDPLAIELKLNFIYVPISVKQNINITNSNIIVEGHNFPNLQTVFSNFNNKQNNSIVGSNAKFFVIKNRNIGSKTILTGKVLENKINLMDNFVSFPENITGKIKKIEVNYNKINSINDGSICSIEVENTNIESGSILHIKGKAHPNKPVIKELEIDIKFLKETKKNSCNIVDYKFFYNFLQFHTLNKLFDVNGTEILSLDNIKTISAGQRAIYKLCPTNDHQYFELINNPNNKHFITVRNNDNLIVGAGTISKIILK